MLELARLQAAQEPRQRKSSQVGKRNTDSQSIIEDDFLDKDQKTPETGNKKSQGSRYSNASGSNTTAK